MKPPSRNSTLVVLNSAIISDPLADSDGFPDISRLRPRAIQPRCEHCKTTNQRCERESANDPCRNCIEGGLADTCIAKPTTTAFTYPPTPPVLVSQPEHTAALPPTVVTSTFTWLYNRFILKLNDLSPLIHLVPIPFLLFTPLYYHYKSNYLYDTDDPSRFIQDFDDWNRRSRSRSPQNTTTTTPNNTLHPHATQHANSSIVSLDIPLASMHSHPSVVEPNPNIVTMQRQPSLPSSTSNNPQLPQLELPDSIKQLGDSWHNYLRARLWEWRVLFMISGFIFTTAPTIFQIQKAYEDPLSRTLAFLAIFKAIVSLLYAPLFLYYFGESGDARQAGFAVLWTKETRGTKSKWGPWITLSLPASATLWALILYTLSLLSFMWRATAPTAAGNTSDDSDAAVSLSHSTASLLRALLVIFAVFDVAGVAWAWKWMLSLTSEVKKRSA